MSSTLNDLSSPLRRSIDREVMGEIGGITEGRNQEFSRLEERLMGRIKNLEQMVQSNMINKNSDKDYDLVQPYESGSIENRPQMTPAGLSDANDHVTHLSNHELHQMKNIYEKDHRRKPITILDESLGDILDKTINFLVYSYEGYTNKLYESELMEDVKGYEGGYYKRFKVHLIAMILFIRDDRNIVYIGFLMIFFSIIIYFINIITIRDA
jgi:hypothetical protein